MKRFSSLNENCQNNPRVCVTSDCNPGNSMALGVTNHYTPIENILLNVKNLFCGMLGIVASIAEDGVSIKLHSTRFRDKKDVENALNSVLYNSQSLYSYITQQGLNVCKCISVGQYCVVYFSPGDMQSIANAPEEEIKKQINKELDCLNNVPCTEMLEFNISESEMYTLFESEDDTELANVRKENIQKIITAKDKIKAAKELGIIVAQSMSLPTDFYFSGVKSADGDESIALRWKYIKRRPHGKSSEITKSLLNIFGIGDNAIWVGDFDKDSMFKLPDDVKKLIENILDILDAEKTSDPCVYKITEVEESKKDKAEKDKEEKDKKAEEDDKVEDDASRGDDSDKTEEDKKDKKDEKDDLFA